MKLINDSPFHAISQTADLLLAELAAVVIVKSTFELDDDGALTISKEGMPLVPDRLETPFGELHGEVYFKKRGVDVCVLGSVVREEPVTQTRVRLRVGNRFTHELLVTGDRVWQRDARSGELVAGPPQPFTRMIVGYTHAFGGVAEYNDEPTPHPDNPIGRGYYLDEDQALRARLPNIESAADPPMRGWDDRPRVAGWGPYPSYWALRAVPNVKVDPERYAVVDIDPAIFNHAHPDLVQPELRPGTPIIIDGLRERSLSLRVPEPPARVHLQLGDERREITAPIDGVFLWTDARKLVITQRARFDYVYRGEQLRRVYVTPR